MYDLLIHRQANGISHEGRTHNRKVINISLKKIDFNGNDQKTDIVLECLTAKVLTDGRLIMKSCLMKGYLEWNGTAAKDEFQVNETVINEWEDRMERAATIASSLEAEHASGVQKLKFDLRLHLNKSYNPPLSRVNTLRSGEDSMKLKEMMECCTKLSVRALDL
ncbi:hypothetical protein Tco_0806494 [Tanacetum coccineum]